MYIDINNSIVYSYNVIRIVMRGSRGGDRGSGHPLSAGKNHNATGFLSNIGPDPLGNHKATKPAFDVGPLSTASEMPFEIAFRWRSDYGRLLVVYGSSISKQHKKRCQS